jgi:hypothetical protein
VRLAQNASERSDRDFGFPRRDSGIDSFAVPQNELEVTAFLACFYKSHDLKAALDYAKAQG